MCVHGVCASVHFNVIINYVWLNLSSYVKMLHIHTVLWPQRVSTPNIIHQHSRFFYLAFLTPVSRTFFSQTSSLQFLFYW